jgi:acyl-coenzyme A thioesterase PaaI-like protein
LKPTGERLMCRARVIKPGRQVAVVAADVFCMIDGVEKHTATALASIAISTRKQPPESQARPEAGRA